MAKPDSKREGRKESSSTPKTPDKPRPRQDSLDRERAAGEGMLPPSRP